MPMWSRTAFMRAPDRLRGSYTLRIRQGAVQQIRSRRIWIDLTRRDPIDEGAKLTGGKHVALEMIHELLRYQLAKAVLAANPAAVRLGCRRSLTKPPDRLEQFRDALAGRRHGLQDRR